MYYNAFWITRQPLGSLEPQCFAFFLAQLVQCGSTKVCTTLTLSPLFFLEFHADLISVVGVTTNYTATADDEYIGVNSAAAVTITLPGSPAQGRVYIIKDELGQGSGKITIQPPVGTLIDSKVSYVIGVPNQSVQMVYRAGGWWII
jgi:hypothetical protein